MYLYSDSVYASFITIRLTICVCVCVVQDYILVVPESSYSSSYLSEEPLDKSYDFISNCGQNSFYIKYTILNILLHLNETEHMDGN